MSDTADQQAGPLDEIRRAERAAARAIQEAEASGEQTVARAHAKAATLVREARARGEATAARRYEEGMSRAHDAARRVETIADDRVAALRRKAEPRLSAAVDAVVAYVLPTRKET